MRDDDDDFHDFDDDDLDDLELEPDEDEDDDPDDEEDDDELEIYDLDQEDDDEDDLDFEDEEEEVELDEDDIEDYEVGGGVEASCPHCGETMEIFVDPAGGASQEYVEDCPVCCRPSAVHVTVEKEGVSTVELEPLD